MARGFADAFAGYDAIVSPLASCTAMVREYHGQLADEAGDGRGARAVAEIAPRVHDLSTLLTSVLGVSDVGAYFPHRVTYHPTCHSLRMLRVGDAPLRLREVRGLELAELPAAETGCGFGGTFSVKNPDVSAAMWRAALPGGGEGRARRLPAPPQARPRDRIIRAKRAGVVAELSDWEQLRSAAVCQRPEVCDSSPRKAGLPGTSQAAIIGLVTVAAPSLVGSAVGVAGAGPPTTGRSE